MKTEQNIFMRFFSSIRLTIFTLIILAITSVIGTIIPQNKPPEFYIQNFGEGLATVFQVLSVPDMYNSWWFVFFLALLSMNLIICTIDRFPSIWKMATVNILDQDPARLEKMASRNIFKVTTSPAETSDAIGRLLKKGGWPTLKTSKEGGELLGSQKGAWTRLGVIAVHASIIIIFIGAIIGAVLGARGSVMIPEGSAADKFYVFGTQEAIPLNFQVRCDDFSLTFYDDGAPKEYRSELSVLENGQEVLKKSIVVNDPLDYKGYTFYQASYEGYNEYLVHIKNETTQEEQQFLIPPGKQIRWTDDISFGIINMEGRGAGGGNRFKIWFNDGKTDASTFWMNDARTVKIERPDTVYSFTLKQRFATGLQVTKDPGVWYVYIGCGLMILGLFVTFFLSHRRLWAYIKEDGSGSRIVIAGTANKNKLGFERDFDALTTLLKNNEQLNLIEG